MNKGEDKDSSFQPILCKNMRRVTFGKGGYSVTFPKDALNRLHELAMRAEKLNVEVNAELFVKDVEVKDVLFPAMDKIT